VDCSFVRDIAHCGNGRELLAMLRCRAFCGSVRRLYLSETWFYSPEAGYFEVDEIAPSRNVYELVCFMVGLLAEEPPRRGFPHPQCGFEPLLLVSTTKFKTHRTADGEGLVVDRWRGRVYRVMAHGASPRRFVAAGSFAEACSLARLLGDSGVFPLS